MKFQRVGSKAQTVTLGYPDERIGENFGNCASHKMIRFQGMTRVLEETTQVYGN